MNITPLEDAWLKRADMRLVLVDGHRVGLRGDVAVWCHCTDWVRRGFHALEACEHMQAVNGPLADRLGQEGVQEVVEGFLRSACSVFGRSATADTLSWIAGGLIATCEDRTFPSQLAIARVAQGMIKSGKTTRDEVEES